MKYAVLSKLTKKSIFKMIGLALLSTTMVLLLVLSTNPVVLNAWNRYFNRKTVAERVDQYQARVDSLLEPLFKKRGISYPPENVTLLYIKDEKKLYLYAGNKYEDVKYIKTYDVLAASGGSGPKLKNGDRQVPEGVYSVDSLNPNSLYHLALRLNYPNAFDKQMAERDGRFDLGTDIMIHGNKVSVGCIAIGDENIEELFVLAAKSRFYRWRLVLAPTDLRMRFRAEGPNRPKWIQELDDKLLLEFMRLF